MIKDKILPSTTTHKNSSGQKKQAVKEKKGKMQ